MSEEIIIYLLKVSLGLGIISLSYLLFRNDAGLRIKRFFLLFGMIACWVFPLLHFPQLVDFSSEGAVEVATAPVNVRSAMVRPVSQGQEVEEASFNWLFFATVIYIIGMLFILFRNIGLINRWSLRRKNGVSGGDNIVFTEGDYVFTLFSWIFLPEKYRNDPSFDSIILHEKAHVEQLHYIDLIIIELTILFTWFNPFTWLISGMIKENHEHLADRKVLAGGVNPAHYRAQLLNFSLGTTYFRLGHQFNYSLTKTRFKMMKRTERKRSGMLKYFLVIPVVLSAMAVFTGSTASGQKTEVQGSVYFADTGRPAQGASVVVRGTTRGTLVNSTGMFSLDCENDEVIVISFVGYSTIKIKAGDVTARPLMLEEKSYELDLKKVEAEKNAKVKIEVLENKSIEYADPVIVVEGKVVDNMDEIKNDDIESVTVIKDSSSELAKKYNADGGLILIEMKKGTEGINEEEIFIVVEDMAQFPGGLPALKAYIYENLKYPAKAMSEGIEGEVVVEFLVNTSGRIEDIKVSGSTYEGFNDAAMDVFRNMPAWEPGKQRGMPVKVKLHVPVEFKLDRE
ncbi:MAG: TonB family protein [Bacteroidales bacterium]